MEIDNIHPDFDGHLEKRLRDITPKEKLLYLSQQIEFRYFARQVVKKKRKGSYSPPVEVPDFTLNLPINISVGFVMRFSPSRLT